MVSFMMTSADQDLEKAVSCLISAASKLALVKKILLSPLLLLLSNPRAIYA